MAAATRLGLVAPAPMREVDWLADMFVAVRPNR